MISLDLGSVFQFYRRKEIWVILFYKSNQEESKKLQEEYKTLADKMFGIIKVGAIDCQQEEELCEEFGVFDAPVVKIYTEMLSDDGVTFTGKKEWKAISSAASAKMQSFVRTVTEENYEDWIQESPEKNKVLLFTDRKSTAPLFKSLSKTYKDRMMFGEVKKEPKLIENFKVVKFPTLMVITDPYEYKGEVYQIEGFKIDQLQKFLSTFSSAAPPKVEKKFEQLTYQKAKSPNSGLCGQKTSDLCLIIFLTGKGQALVDQYLPLVEEFKTDKVSLTYVYTNEEPYICNQFGITGQAGAVLFKPKRNKYAKLEDVDSSAMMIEPARISAFIESGLHSGAISWNSGKKDEWLRFREVEEKSEL